jgi:hypothetical protein
VSDGASSGASSDRAHGQVLNVSQSWHGHPGYLVMNASAYFNAEVERGARREPQPAGVSGLGQAA